MRILLIACSYPPDPVVGSFRAAKLARAFSNAGHEVDVVTSRLEGESNALRVDAPRLRVHTVREVAGPQAAYRRLKAALAGRTPETAPGPSRPGGRRHEPEPPRWKRYLLSAMSVPDNRKGFVPAALAKARPILRSGVDLVYTTAPPFSTHLAGLAIRRTAGIRWVAEFRDPWTENKSRRHLRSRGADAVNRWLERLCVRHADQLVAVSEGTRVLLAAKLPEHRRRDVLLALNGIDNLLPVAEVADITSGAFRIVHLGDCYAGRDPRPFLRALANVVARKRLDARDIRMEFIGNCRHYAGASLEGLVAELGIADVVVFHDWMPQTEARRQARTADLFLLPFPRHQGLIPNKLFDYLGFRKPILAFVDPEGETARILRRTGRHHVVTDASVEAAERAIETALAERGRSADADGSESVLLELTTERQMHNLLTSLSLTQPGES
jgi:glycosyltransferase involved in cell wall biosynthesis